MNRPRPVQKSGRLAGQPYQHSQAHYARTFGKNERTIKRWWKDGLPLDDADAMGEYLSPRGRTSGQEPPDDRFGDPPPPPRPGDDQADAESSWAEQSFNTGQPDPSFLDGEGLKAAIARISKVEKKLAAKLDEILSRPGPLNFRELSNRLGVWIGMLKTMGKLEKDAPGILEQHKRQIDIGEVEEGVTKLIIAIVGRLEMLPTRAMQTLAGFTNPQDIREELEKEIAGCLAPILKCQWMPAEILAELLPAAAAENLASK